MKTQKRRRWMEGATEIVRALQSKHIFAGLFATFAVVVMVVVLTITINHSREQKIIHLFSEQQNKLCRSLSLASASIFDQTENELRAFAGKLPTASRDREIALRNFYALNKNTIADVFLINPQGKVVSRSSQTRMDVGAEQLCKRNKEFFASRGDVFLPVCVSLSDGSMLTAIVALTSLFSHLHFEREGELASSVLIATQTGELLAQIPRTTKKLFTRETLESLTQTLRAAPAVPETFPTLVYMEEGKKKSCIASACRVGENNKAPLLILATDLDEVISAARVTFFNNMVGVLFLVVIIIISASIVLYNLYNNLRLKQQIDSMRTTQEWERTIGGIIEGSPIATFVIDQEHTIIFWNKACEELTGYAGAEMVGTKKQYEPFYGNAISRPVIADLIVDDNLEELKAYYGKKRVRPSPTVANAYQARDFYENLNGKPRHLFFLAAPIFDDRGNIVAAIETLQDVSETEEMNKRLTEYAESLENEMAANTAIRKEIENIYNYLQSIINSFPDTVLDVNDDGTINNVLHHDSSTWREDYKRRHIKDLGSESQQEFLLAKWEAIQKGEINSFEIEVPTTRFSTRHFFITCSPIGGINRHVVVCRDITDIKSLGKKFYESQRLAAMGRMATGIAHEVRNPLSSIKMSLQILKKRLMPEGNDLRRLDIALTEVAHLGNLVSDILLYAKPAEPIKKPAHLNKVLEDALFLQESALTAKSIAVNKEFPNASLTATIDEGMMMQVFVNLYRNAIEAMSEGGELTIKATPSSSGEVIAEISDNGRGISVENMAHIFEPFFTADKPHGTGLGLPQVKRLVELHGGNISVSSTHGRGTVVRITLPA